MDELRKQLLSLLRGGEAHMGFLEAVADFPMDRINEFPPNVDPDKIGIRSNRIGVDYTPWHLLEHIRITQWDILDFIRNPDYKYLEWPKDYWPPKDQKASKKDWDKTISGFIKDAEELQKIAEDSETDFSKVVPWGDSPNQTILRELLMVADHDAYHIGEFAILRQVMGTWGNLK